MMLKGSKLDLPKNVNSIGDLLLQLFNNEITANGSSDSTCAIDGETGAKLTMEELREKCQVLAQRLVQYDLVAVCLPPSIQLIVTLCGVVLRGVPYVPIEPSMPLERIKYIVNDSGAKVVVTFNDKQKIDLIKHLQVEVKTFDELTANGSSNKSLIQEVIGSSDNFGVMYTSGSTGQPKGNS